MLLSFLATVTIPSANSRVTVSPTTQPNLKIHTFATEGVVNLLKIIEGNFRFRGTTQCMVFNSNRSI